VRRELWGYAPDEALSPDDLIAESYRGIRPAPGYPAQPDHTEKATIFRLLDAEAQIGVKLTESFAMWPGASVSGIYLAHPTRTISASQGRARPGRRLRGAQGHGDHRGRALARADPQLQVRLSRRPTTTLALGRMQYIAAIRMRRLRRSRTPLPRATWRLDIFPQPIPAARAPIFSGANAKTPSATWMRR
jgi:hypothetical protein